METRGRQDEKETSLWGARQTSLSPTTQAQAHTLHQNVSLDEGEDVVLPFIKQAL